MAAVDRRAILIAAGVGVGVWPVAALADALRFDWLLLPVLLVAVASVLDIGRTLLDRLVIAGGVLAGLLVVEGLLFSVWPWGLQPVAVGGFTLDVIVVVGLLRWVRAGRGPGVPWRVRGSDLIILAAPVAAWFSLRFRIHGRAFSELLPYLIWNPDRRAHFSYFDTAHRLGGYAFVHPQRAKLSQPDLAYPTGTHYLYTLLDDFRRSSTEAGGPKQEFLRYFQYEALGVCLLALTITWATRWIAGPHTTGWHRVLICGTIAALAGTGPLTTLFWEGFDAEVAGLALLALIVALAARPPRGPREHVAALALLLISEAFVYPLFLADMVPIALVSLAVARRRMARARGSLITVAASATITAAIPVAQLFRIDDVGGVLNQGAFTPDVQVWTVWVFALAPAAAMLTRAGRRTPVWAVVVIATVVSMTVAICTESVGVLSVGGPRYYSTKFLFAAAVIGMAGFGVLGTLAARLRRPDRRYRVHYEVAFGTAMVLFATTAPRGYAAHFADEVDMRHPISESIDGYLNAVPLDGVPTILVVSPDPWIDYDVSDFFATLNHQRGLPDRNALIPAAGSGGTVPDTGTAFSHDLIALNALPTGTPIPESDPRLARVETWLDGHDAMRLVVTNPTFADALRRRFTAQRFGAGQYLSVLTVPPINPPSPEDRGLYRPVAI